MPDNQCEWWNVTLWYIMLHYRLCQRPSQKPAASIIHISPNHMQGHTNVPPDTDTTSPLGMWSWCFEYWHRYSKFGDNMYLLGSYWKLTLLQYSWLHDNLQLSHSVLSFSYRRSWSWHKTLQKAFLSSCCSCSCTHLWCEIQAYDSSYLNDSVVLSLDNRWSFI